MTSDDQCCFIMIRSCRHACEKNEVKNFVGLCLGVSERARWWAQRSVWAVWSKQMSKRCAWTSEQMAFSHNLYPQWSRAISQALKHWTTPFFSRLKYFWRAEPIATPLPFHWNFDDKLTSWMVTNCSSGHKELRIYSVVPIQWGIRPAILKVLWTNWTSPMAG